MALSFLQTGAFGIPNIISYTGNSHMILDTFQTCCRVGFLAIWDIRNAKFSDLSPDLDRTEVGFGPVQPPSAFRVE